MSDQRGRGVSRDVGPLPSPGEQAMAGAAIAIGIILLGLQLWALTVALELYLAGEGERVWALALVSGVIFIGGILALRALRDRRA